MKQFFKLTSFKFILAFVIAILPIAGSLLYHKSIVPTTEEGLKIEAPLGVRALYYTSEILFIPLSPIKNLFVKFEQKHLNPTFYLEKQKFFAIIAVPYLLLYSIYSYLLSCIISLIINKVCKTIKNRKG